MTCPSETTWTLTRVRKPLARMGLTLTQLGKYDIHMTPPPPPRHLDPVTDPINVALGTAIRNEMTDNKVSVNALHIATGLSRQTITRSIEGTRTLDVRQFDRIAQALGGRHVELIRKALEAL